MKVYSVVVADSIAELEQEVTRLLNEGYMVFGGIVWKRREYQENYTTAIENTYLQPMVKDTDCLRAQMAEKQRRNIRRP